VGTGSRVVMFLDAIAGPYAGNGVLVGLCDVSPTRMAWHNRRLGEKFGLAPLPTFGIDAFEEMIRSTRPDVVIVTSVDSTHHDYVVRAMRAGCDVICEKPMTICAAGVRAIFEAIAQTGKRLRVSFNYRYAPHTTMVRDLIQQGTIGRPLAVDLHWVLDTSHGADYFRRWHAELNKSGGLLVHKATHHFDIINWWIDSYPERVFAMGDLKFYGPGGRSMNKPAEPFRFKWEQYPDQQQLYTGQALIDSGYQRDRDVFGDHVTIYDTMSATTRYRNGVIFNYSLLAYSPWEGFRASITGTDGRIELYSKHGSHILTATGDADLAAQQSSGEETRLTLFPMFGSPRDVPIPHADGAHGGGDVVMLEQVFSPNPPADPFGRAATHVDGAASVLLGVAANESIATGKPIDIDDLFPLPQKSGASR
jgi:predicted dehydrogenase